MLRLKIAFRFLLKKPVQTLIAFTVVASGVGALHFVLNAGVTMKELVYSTTAEASSHIYVNDVIPFEGYEAPEISGFREEMFAKDKQIVDISYSYTIGASMKNEAKEKVNFNLKGVDFNYAARIHEMDKRIEKSSFNSFPQPTNDTKYDGEILLGEGLAAEFNLEKKRKSIGKIIKVDVNNQQYKFKVVGIYLSDQVILNSQMMFTTIDVVQKITSAKVVNAIEMRIKNPLKSDRVLANVEPIINEYYPQATYTEWQAGNRYAVNALYIENISITIIQIFTALAITFGISALLSFMMRDRVKQIGILKALGFTNKDTVYLVLYQVLIIASTGIISGIFLGGALARLFSIIFRRPSGVPLLALKTGFFNSFTLISAAIMIVGCLVACLPSIMFVKKLKMIEVIKDE